MEFFYKIILVGIWLHESGVLGASPDGFIQGNFTQNVHLQKKIDIMPDIIEVKWPLSKMTVAEASSAIKDFFLGKSI